MLEDTGTWDKANTYQMSYAETKELKFDIEVGDEVTHCSPIASILSCKRK